MGEISIWHWVVVVGAIALFLMFRSGKQEADRSDVSTVPRDARKSLLFGDVTLVSDAAGARAQIEKMAQEAKDKSQEYEWQFKDSGRKDSSKNDLHLQFDLISGLLIYKRDNIGLTDEQILAKSREHSLDHFFKGKSLQEIDEFSNAGYKYLEKHPATKFFRSYLWNDDEFKDLKRDAKASLSASLISSARDAVRKARNIIPNDPNITLVDQGLNALGPNGNYAAFTRQGELNALNASLRQAELKALSTNRAKVFVKGRSHNSETPFRNAQEAYERAKSGLYVPAACEITCFVTDAYGASVKVFSGSTDWHNDFSGFKFHTAWRPQ